MEEVSVRTVYVAGLAFVFGAGFSLFQLLDDWAGRGVHPLDNTSVVELAGTPPEPAEPPGSSLEGSRAGQRDSRRAAALSPQDSAGMGAAAALPQERLPPHAMSSWEAVDGLRSGDTAVSATDAAAAAVAKAGRVGPSHSRALEPAAPAALPPSPPLRPAVRRPVLLPALRVAGRQGLQSALMAGSGAAVFGTVRLARHGYNSGDPGFALYSVRDDPYAAVLGVGAAYAAYVGPDTAVRQLLRSRGALPLLAAATVGDYAWRHWRRSAA
jgi:hypothetical protein